LAVERNRFEIVKLLLNCLLVDVNKTIPLCSAVHSKRINCLKLLLAHPNIQINAVNEYNETALFFIADYFWRDEKDALREVIDLLIKAGIDSTVKDNYGDTVFDVVRRQARAEVCEVLTQAFAVEISNL
jgi:ankyrin repeat protein